MEICSAKCIYFCTASFALNSWYNLYRKINGDCIAGRVMKVFKIPKVPSTTAKSIRFPNDVIENIEAAIRGTNCTFTAFVVEAVRVALENLAEEEEE